uniref:EF-hand domain-containing protein n=2 Tax=Haptolina brevifila TaxID=156173 RepID=A0A7S2G8B0_9EUKA
MAEAHMINVMPDLQPVLREFTKAVLRDMPSDVLSYSKEWFVEKAASLRMESYQLPPSTSKPFNELSGELQGQIEDVFKRYDVDMDGSITIEELKVMMDDLGGLFGFSGDVDASTLMALLDSDGDKTISWQEWSHACAVWLSDMA